MSAELRIRLAADADVPAIGALIAASTRGLSVGFYTEEEAERAIERVFGVDSQLLADGTFYVAEEAGAIVGCGGWSMRATLYGGDQMKQGEDPKLRPGVDPARIRAFFVAPSQARRGIGRRLLEFCEGAARAHGFTSAELMATLPGVPLYSALGYARGENVNVDMGDGYVLRCIRMFKSLEEKA
jgi:GNAT superfamily N-acetyltransferase